MKRDPHASRRESKAPWQAGDGRLGADAAVAERRAAQVARIRANQERKAAELTAQSEATRKAEARRSAFVAELGAMPLWVESQEKGQIPEAYRALAAALYDVRTSGRSKAMLVWPTGNISLAASHALCSLGLQRASPVTLQPERRREAAASLRALFYPYTSRTRLPLRRVYVDRTEVSAVCLDHIADPTRRSGPGYDYFSRLCRAKDLTGRIRGGAQHFEYEHPTLDEVVSIVGLGAAKDVDVLGRIANRTDLKHLSNRAGDPALSPYAIFGLPAAARLRPAERRAADLDVILLDLTRSGRNRLGPDWRGAVVKALGAITAAYGDLPVLAATDDSYVHRVLAWEILKAHDRITGKAPAAHDAILGLTPAIAASGEPAPPDLSAVAQFAALGCADPDAALLSDLTRAITRARLAGDAQAAGLLDEIAGVARRTAGLPGGVEGLGLFLADGQGIQAAHQSMAGYALEPLVRAADELSGPYVQQRHAEFSDLVRRAAAWVEARRTSSPIGLMLRDLLHNGLNGATRKVIWSQTATISEFAEKILTSDAEIGARIAHRIASNMITFMDALAFREIGALPRSELAMTKQVLVVSPQRSQALALITQPWLPSSVTLVADERTLLSVGREAQQLAKFPAFAVYAERLSRLGEAALSEAARVRGRALDATLEMPADDVDFPEGGVIDLAGRRAPGEKVVRIEMKDRRTILARRKTRLIRYDPDGAVPTFAACLAEDVAEGDQLCVVDEAFIDMARARLDIRATAAEEIRDYHARVQTQFAKLDGGNGAERLRTLVSRMGPPTVLEGTARAWTHLAAEVEKPLDLVLPRAPQDWETFRRFMTALGVPQPLAESYWAWAVILTRKSRIKAAMRLHEAYLSILVDAFSAEHVSPARRADIRALRATAEGYVSVVASRKIEA